MRLPDSISPLGARLLLPIERFFHIEAASGIVLLAAAIIALAWCNSGWSSTYEALWAFPLGLEVGAFTFSQDLRFWINDGLMAVFFLLVGLEIRRELHEGALASPRLALLPLAAACGGVVVPALIYLAWNQDPPAARGWAVPTATDIAFAIGALTLLGRRVSPGARILLLSIAVIDDIVAILVIAFFYSSGIQLTGLVIAAGGLLATIALQKLGVRRALPYVIPGTVVWIGLLSAGIHPSLAGVLMGLLAPVSSADSTENLFAKATRTLDVLGQRVIAGEKNLEIVLSGVRELKAIQREFLPPVVRAQLALHPWVAYGIMPLFALANAGAAFQDVAFPAVLESPVVLGIVTGLILGKPLGIVVASALFVKLRWCELPPDVTRSSVVVIGCFGGIGFTMSIFISVLAFGYGETLPMAKLGVLLASVTAAGLGLLLGRRMLPLLR